MDKLRQLYNNLSQRERILFFCAMGAIFLMVLDLAVLGPILSEIRVLDAKIEETSQSIRRDLRIISFKERILGEYKRYEKFLDNEDKTQEEIIGALLKKLENLATQHEIKMTNVMPGDIEEKSLFKVYKTSLEFEGELGPVLVFMNALEESDNLFKISKYSLTPKSKTGKLMKVSADISRVLISSEDIGVFAEDMEQVPSGLQITEEASAVSSDDQEMPFTEAFEDLTAFEEE